MPSLHHSTKPFAASMKTKLPVLCFFSVIFALTCFTGCETSRTSAGSQKSEDSDTTVTVSTFAGSVEGFADGVGSAAQFYAPFGIALDRSGNLYVADTANHRIRKITPKGEVSTLAGSTKGFADGIGSAAQFDEPADIALDRSGNLYVADFGNHRIRKITPKGEVSTFIGNTRGFADGIGSAAQFNKPSGIAIDAAGNLYVAEFGNGCIRKITPKGEVSTLAGDAPDNTFSIQDDARFQRPVGIAIDTAGNLYVADGDDNRIRKVTPKGEVSTLAGSGISGDADGMGSAAQFDAPVGIAIDAAGNLYVGDLGNNRIRKITPKGEVSTLAGGTRGFADGIGSIAQFQGPTGIAIDAAGNLYVADNLNHRIRKIERRSE